MSWHFEKLSWTLFGRSSKSNSVPHYWTLLRIFHTCMFVSVEVSLSAYPEKFGLGSAASHLRTEDQEFTCLFTCGARHVVGEMLWQVVYTAWIMESQLTEAGAHGLAFYPTLWLSCEGQLLPEYSSHWALTVMLSLWGARFLKSRGFSRLTSASMI